MSERPSPNCRCGKRHRIVRAADRAVTIPVAGVPVRAVLAVVLLAAGGCEEQQDEAQSVRIVEADQDQERDQSVRAAEADPLRLIEAFASKPPDGVDTLEKRLSVELPPVAQDSNEFYDIYRAEDGPGRFSGVELRAPASPEATGGQLLILDLPETPCTDLKPVVQRLGMPAGLKPPSAHPPPDAPIYVSYTKPWGELLLGVRSHDPWCVVHVVFDDADEAP